MLNYFEKPREIIAQIVDFFGNWATIEAFLENEWGWHMAIATIAGAFIAFLIIAIPIAIMVAISIAIFKRH